MIIVVLSLILVIGLSSCNVYKNYSSPLFSVAELNIGADMNTMIEKYGNPYSFCKEIVGKDTVVILTYKSPKPVANCEFIVTTEFMFANNKLKKISQFDLFISENIQICDSLGIRGGRADIIKSER